MGPYLYTYFAEDTTVVQFLVRTDLRTEGGYYSRLSPSSYEHSRIDSIDLSSIL